jgi:carboxylesterase type B
VCARWRRRRPAAVPPRDRGERRAAALARVAGGRHRRRTAYATPRAGADAATAAACLRAKTPQQLLAPRARRHRDPPWSPVPGGAILPRDVADSLATGASTGCRSCNGTNHDEGTFLC